MKWGFGKIFRWEMIPSLWCFLLYTVYLGILKNSVSFVSRILILLPSSLLGIFTFFGSICPGLLGNVKLIVHELDVRSWVLDSSGKFSFFQLFLPKDSYPSFLYYKSVWRCWNLGRFNFFHGSWCWECWSVSVYGITWYTIVVIFFCLKMGKKHYWGAVVPTLCWSAWLERNKRKYGDWEESLEKVWDWIKFRVDLWVLNHRVYNHICIRFS